MLENVKKIEKEALENLEKAKTIGEIEEIKAKYVGKNSELIEIIKGIKDLDADAKKEVGKQSHLTKSKIENKVKFSLEALEEIALEIFDTTYPVDTEVGTLHPVTIVAKEVTDILEKMGFMILSGPEKDSEYYNFESLNVPKDHPARDMQDTYWTSDGDVLRTQTSAVQNRAMKEYGVPLRMAAPGRCFRNEDMDASHENTFFQLEGLVIDKDVTIENLIYVMKSILKEIYKTDVDVRLRPGYFPFVEPGFELDIKCAICGGDGCSTCKNTGWIELLPCGMVHPNVLKEGGVDPEEYTGFAFGIGLTRMAMLKYKIDDIRLMNSGDIRVLSQFGEGQ